MLYLTTFEELPKNFKQYTHERKYITLLLLIQNNPLSQNNIGGENVGKIRKAKIANKLKIQSLAILFVPRAGIEQAWK